MEYLINILSTLLLKTEQYNFKIIMQKKSNLIFSLHNLFNFTIDKDIGSVAHIILSSIIIIVSKLNCNY